jgi:YHS domain-containing protein
MKKFWKSSVLKVSVLLGVIAVVFALQSYSVAGTRAKNQPEVKRVETNQVCMVNDTFMNKPQIPVSVEGKTYYGCCEGCVGRLKGDRSVRFSTDPITGREVDKAAAYITTQPDGTVLYFESMETANKYASQQAADK